VSQSSIGIIGIGSSSHCWRLFPTPTSNEGIEKNNNGSFKIIYLLAVGR